MTAIKELGEYKTIELSRDIEVVEKHRDAIANKATVYLRKMPIDIKPSKFNEHSVFSKLYSFNSIINRTCTSFFFLTNYGGWGLG